LFVVVPCRGVADVDGHGSVFDDVVACGLLGAAHGGTPTVAEHLEEFLAGDNGGGLDCDVEVDTVGGGRGLRADADVPVFEVGLDAFGHDHVVDSHDVRREGGSGDLVVGGGDGHIEVFCGPLVAGPHGKNPLAVTGVVSGDEVACDFDGDGAVDTTGDDRSSGSHGVERGLAGSDYRIIRSRSRGRDHDRN